MVLCQKCGRPLLAAILDARVQAGAKCESCGEVQVAEPDAFERHAYPSFMTRPDRGLTLREAIAVEVFAVAAGSRMPVSAADLELLNPTAQRLASYAVTYADALIAELDKGLAQPQPVPTPTSPEPTTKAQAQRPTLVPR